MVDSYTVLFNYLSKLSPFFSECEKSEEHLLNTWFPKITSVFTDKKIHIKHKGERLSRFYRCASSLVSIQVLGRFPIETKTKNRLLVTFRKLFLQHKK